MADTLSERVVVSVSTAPAAVGPYSQAIKWGNMVFLSGQIPLDPKSGEIVGSDVTAQTEQIMKNIMALLDVVGSGPSLVLKTTVFLKSLETFAEMNEVYARYFPVDPPARSTIEVSRLPKDSLVEIEVTAALPNRQTHTVSI